MFSHKIDNSVIVCQLCIVIVWTIKLEAEALFDSLLILRFYSSKHLQHIDRHFNLLLTHNTAKSHIVHDPML